MGMRYERRIGVRWTGWGSRVGEMDGAAELKLVGSYGARLARMHGAGEASAAGLTYATNCLNR